MGGEEPPPPLLRKEEEVIKSFLPHPSLLHGLFTGSQTVYYHRRRSEVVQSQEIDRGISHPPDTP